MRRLFGALLAAAATISVVTIGTAATASAAVAADPTPCTGPIQVISFAFDPPTVVAGDPSTATLVLRNCTDATVSVQGIWTARFTAPSTSTVPSGCVVFDPLAQHSDLAPGGTATQTLTYTTFPATLPQCAATGLDAMVSLSSGGGQLGTVTAHLTIIRQTPPSTCRVQSAMTVWTGGFVASLTITNTGTTAINGWTLVFTLPAGQKIVNGWGAVIRVDGQTVTITNEPWNATIGPGASVSVGYQGTWTTTASPPTAFTLNGAPCAVG